MRRAASAILLIVGAACFPSWALADPCAAPLPRAGTVFDGQVRYVGDGDSICVGKTNDPAEWIEIRVADFFAPELNSPGGVEANPHWKELLKASSLFA